MSPKGEMTALSDIRKSLEEYYPVPSHVVRNQPGGGAAAVLTNSVEVLDGEGVTQIPVGALVVGWAYYRDDILPGWTSDSVQYVSGDFDGAFKAAVPGTRWDGNHNVALVMEGHVPLRTGCDPVE